MIGKAIALFCLFFIFCSDRELQYSGQKSTYLSCDRYDFVLNGRDCIIVSPQKNARGLPWVWRARFFDHAPQVDKVLLARGFHLVYIDVAGLFGSPKAVAIWDMYYRYLIDNYGFSSMAVLEGLSRGGLIIYNWAAQNPDKVCCIYADAPACDLKSWPGVHRKEMLAAYGFTAQQALEFRGNPIDNLEPLAKARVALLHVVGDIDTTVPVADNTAIVEKRYKALGGEIKVIHKPGVGHHPHGLEDPSPIVDFIMAHLKRENDRALP